MKIIKAGIIGTGFISPAHIEALRRLGYVDVAAISDINLELAERRAKDLCIARAFGDYKEMLAEPDIEVVHVCTPNYLHYQMSKEALLAGKHVICEKPLAMNAREAGELVALAKDKNLVNAVHFNLRFYPLIQQAKYMIQSGELGAILVVNGSYQQDWLFYETDYNWRLQPEFSGESRAVADIGSHWLDMIEYLTAIKVASVCADFATFHPVRKKPLKPVQTYGANKLNPEDYTDIAINTEDYATVLLRFDNGAHGSMTVNQMAVGRKNRLYFEIYGDKKSIAWDSENPNELWIGNRDSHNGILAKDPSLMHSSARAFAGFPGGHAEGFSDTSKQMFNLVYRRILEKRTEGDSAADYAVFEDGERELALCERILESVKTEKWVHLINR